MSDKLVDQLIRHEGMMLNLYKCPSGKDTIGVGRNLTDMGITEGEALMMLRNDIERCRIELRSAVDVYSGLNEARRDCLVNMNFNMGISRLLQFKKMLSAIAIKDWHTAADEMLNSRWHQQVGDRAKELSEIMRNGQV